MKLATILIGIMLISALFLAACQTGTDNAGKDISLEGTEQAQTEPLQGEDIDIISGDEVDIGELI